MPAPNPEQYKLSASAIGSFKACPTRFRLAYREGLRVAEDTDSQRQGTNWHAMHECYAAEVIHARKVTAEIKAEHPTAQGNENDDSGKANGMDAVINLLNERYANVPTHKTANEWALERTILLVSFIGYQWYFSEDPIEVLASEVPFDLPIHSPTTGMPLPMEQCVRVGKIDHLIRWQNMVGVLERKSTSRAIDPASDYWDRSKKDTQVSMYALALRDMPIDLHLTPHDKSITYGNTLYDVWHKPTIKPKMLTQAETAEFVKTGQYMEQQFVVAWTEAINAGDTAMVNVDGESAEIEQGKKGFAIRETIAMYGARLMQDIYTRPDFYFCRREIARTDAELRKFRKELWSHYQNMKSVEKYGTWTENESACRATFACQYIPICYGHGADAVCDGKSTPSGFRRIFVDLTVNGVDPDE